MNKFYELGKETEEMLLRLVEAGVNIMEYEIVVPEHLFDLQTGGVCNTFFSVFGEIPVRVDPYMPRDTTFIIMRKMG